MRLLRKKGTDVPVYAFTPILAARDDMELVAEQAKRVETTEAGDESDSLPTNKKALKDELAELGVHVKGNPKVKTLQDKLVAARAEAGDEGD